MARIRTIKPDFWEDEGIAVLSRDARLLYIATWNLADDEGLLRWTPEYLKAQVFPYDSDLTLRRLGKLMTEIVDNDFVFPYEAGRMGNQLAFVVRFHQHQRINRPQFSRLSPPSTSVRANVAMYARRDDLACDICGHDLRVFPDGTATKTETPQTGLAEDPEITVYLLTPRSEGGNEFPTNLKSCHVTCLFGLPNSLNRSVSGSMSASSTSRESFTAGRERKGKERNVLSALTETDAILDENHVEIVGLCDALADSVGDFLGSPKKRPKVTDRWIKDMRLLIERGPLGRDAPEPFEVQRIQRCMEILFTKMAEPGRNGFCWAAQVRSPHALREHWDQISGAWQLMAKNLSSEPEYWIDAFGNKVYS